MSSSLPFTYYLPRSSFLFEENQAFLDYLHSNKLTYRWLVLEPQPWKCYMTAARRMRKLKKPEFEHLETIVHRQEKLLPYLTGICETVGFKLVSQLGQTNWERKIFLFEKISSKGIRENN